jgi:Tail tubular protein
MYTELEVVNACLASMSEAPVPVLTIPHPYIARALTLLRKHNKLVQSNRWWFSTIKATLVPVGPSYTVAASLPAGTLGIVPLERGSYVLNGDGTVYNLASGEILTTPLEAQVYRELAFTALPPEANAYITDCVVLEFQRNYDGDSQRTRDLKEQRRESGTQLMAQHIRMTKANFFARIAHKLRAARGDRPVLGSE